MNLYDFQNAFTLVEEKYISEAFTEKYKKKQFFPALLISAAVCAAVVLICFEGRITDNSSVFENYDYSELFIKTQIDINDGSRDSDYDSSTRLRFDTDYLADILPFDISLYQRGYGDAFYGDSGTIESLEITLVPDGSVDSFIFVSIDSRGEIAQNLPLSESDGVERYGSKIYCFEDLSDLYVYFDKEGYKYFIYTWGVGISETGKIADSLLINGLDIASLDEQLAVKYVSYSMPIDNCDDGTVYEGVVPKIKNIGSKKLTDSLVHRESRFKNEVIIYDRIKAEYGKGSEFFIVQFVYGEKIDNHYSIDTFNVYKIGEFDRNALNNSHNITWETYNHYQIILDCGYFYIEICANCPKEELWEYIETVRSELEK